MAFSDTIASVPQSDTDRIARRLLGDDAVDRFGDAIGARKHTWRDVARDFALGMQGGPTKALELKMQMKQQFQKAWDKEAAAAARRREQDRQDVRLVLDTLKTAQNLPPGHRTQMFKETLDQLKIPYSNAAVKMLTDGDLMSQIPFDELLDKNDKEPGSITLGSISAVAGSPKAAIDWITGLTRAKKDREQTGSMILDREIKTLRLKDIQAKIAEQQKTQAMREASLRERVKGQKLENVVKRNKIANPGGGAKGKFLGDLFGIGLAQPGATPAPAPAQTPAQSPPPAAAAETPEAAPAGVKSNPEIEAMKARLGL